MTFSGSRSGKFLPVILSLISNIFWGMSYMITRIALRVSTPLILLSIRFTISAVLLILFILFTGKKISLRGKHLLPFLLLALTQPAGFLCETYAVDKTNSSVAGLGVALIPVFSIFMAAVLLREKPAKKQLFYSIFPILGVTLITVSGTSEGIITAIGVVCLLLSSFFYAGYQNANRVASREFGALERTLAVQVVGAVSFTVAALGSVHWDLKALTAPLFLPEFTIPVLCLCLLCSIVANLCANRAAKGLTVLQFAEMGTITTICSTFCGVLFLREPMTAMMATGAVLVIYGLFKAI